jgi:hypothetical protein
MNDRLKKKQYQIDDVIASMGQLRQKCSKLNIKLQEKEHEL